MHSNAPSTPPPALPGRFAVLIAALLRACGAHIAKDRNAGPWLVLVWNRMNGISQRIQRLAAQIQAGTVPPLRAGFKLARPRKPPTKPPLRLPNNPMWLTQVIQPTAVYGAWLQQLLADPELPAMLAAAPQLARILRPLCRALGVEPPPLPPRPAVRAAPPLDRGPPDPTAAIAAIPDPPPGLGSMPHPAPTCATPTCPTPTRRRPARYFWPALIPVGGEQKPA